MLKKTTTAKKTSATQTAAKKTAGTKTTAKKATKAAANKTAAKKATKAAANKTAAKKATKDAANKTAKTSGTNTAKTASRNTAAKKTTKAAANRTAKTSGTNTAAKKTTKAAANRTAKTSGTKTAAKKTTKAAANRTAKTSGTNTAAKTTTKPATRTAANKTTDAATKTTAKTAATRTAAKKATNAAAKTTTKAPPGSGGGKDSFAKKIAQITARAAEAGVELPPGASESAIAGAEQALGVTFPAEVRAWFAAHDGAGEQFIVDNRELLSLERVVSEWTIWKGLLDGGAFEDNDHSTPGPGVQQVWWIPEWIPLSYDGAGNHDVLDLAPASGGKVGQILSFWHDEDSREVIAPNMLDWLLGVTWGESDE